MAQPDTPKSVLITGCSSGIGAASAHLMREKGWQVFPTARKPEDLARLKAEGFHPIEIDMADSTSIQFAARDVLAACGGKLGGVVNNAGFGQPGAMEDLSREAMRRQFEVNVFGLQELNNLLVPVFRKQGAGRIVNVSSVVGRISLPFLGIYCASKFALEAMSDSLRVELVDSGIAVSLIEPGPIITQFRRNAVDQAEEQISLEDAEYGKLMIKEIKRRRERQKKEDFWNKPPEAVAVKIAHALESSKPKRRYCVTPAAYFGTYMRRFAPYSLTDYVLAKQVRRKRQKIKEMTDAE